MTDDDPTDEELEADHREWADERARRAEQSHVSGDTRREIVSIESELHAQEEPDENGITSVEIGAMADALVARLSPAQLAEIVGDWLDSDPL
jgi:hypothetical protein